jgi:MoaA/NifB/PqqE/SkfB family radical SAM enzyme
MGGLLFAQAIAASSKAERRHNFLDLTSKALSASSRSHLTAFIRGEPPGAFHPITVTLDPTLDCNADCSGCIEQTSMSRAQRRSIPWPRMQTLIPELHALGVRAIELYGGEPTLYPHFADLLRLICGQGLRLAIATNGTLLHCHLDVLEEVRSCLSWLRISVNAGTTESRRRTFCFPDGDTFELILASAEKLAERGLLIGFSFVVNRMNYDEITQCSRLCEQIGGQCLELKPFVHPVSKQLLSLPAYIRQVIQAQVEEALAQRRHLDFQIVLTESLKLALETQLDEDLRQPKDYSFCPATLYRAVVSPLSPPGQVLSCPYHRASPKHAVGTLAYPLDKAWLQSEERARALAACNPREDCNFWCNRHSLNKALWEWRRRYEAGERNIFDSLPVTDHPGDYWL